MLDYSGTPKPVGNYNDPVGIEQHTRPSVVSVDKWKAMVDDDQTLHFTQRYLETPGENTITRLGYDYGELSGILNSRTVSTKGLYPWSIAIQPQSQWTFRQRVVSDLYFSRKERGNVRGFLSTGKKHLKNAVRTVRKELSCPDNRS